jgi:endonuclease/exonuclease/phosphatase family metal-dependent hydrolase
MQTTEHTQRMARRFSLTHSLTPLLAQFGEHKTRASLEKDRDYKKHRHEIDRLLRGFAWDLDGPNGAAEPHSPTGTVRAAAWNIERGKRFDSLLGTLQNNSVLRQADILLLNEVDLGMGRSQNRDVTREIASALQMRYVFANNHLVLSPGDIAELEHGVPNTLSLHGNALLSRYPIRYFEAFGLPEYHDKFRVLEKRLGEKRCLLVELLLPDGPLWVAVVHLDPFCSMKHRGKQLHMILQRLVQLNPPRFLIGGDFNTTTYNLQSSVHLGINLAHKLLRLGFTKTIEQYLTPEAIFEKPVFKTLQKFGVEITGFNDRTKGSIYFDINDPELKQKSLDYVPRALWNYVENRMHPWNGVVPLRFDWFGGKGLTPKAAYVIERPIWGGQHAADHNPIAVDISVGSSQ